ncbi:MAG TPA: YceI family protein, partial [Propionibacterium sp.]|nr:YceI family protein [Propionibacterium sp.]
MTVTPGRHALTQADGDLLIHTTCAGPAARLGHDLTLIAQRWEATLDTGERPVDCQLDVTVELDSLVVRDSRGGAKAMSAGDRKEIERNAAKSLHVAKHPVLRFVSTGITGSWSEGE